MEKAMHMVCVGATGMLWSAAKRWHGEGHRLTLLARRPGRVSKEIAQMNAPVPAFISTDYHHDAALIDALGQVDGEVDCLVAWVHGSAPRALDVMVDVLRPERLIHVLGSAAAHPSEGVVEPLRARHAPQVELYQQVVLGFAYGTGHRSRWLTHEEISEGVWCAYESKETLAIVGQVEPWEDRP